MAPKSLPALPTFEKALPLGETDAAFVAEISSVLSKYGNLDRFGICLLHEHFAISDDETLLETHFNEQRTLMVSPVKRESAANLKPTIWRLLSTEAPEGTAQPLQFCGDRENVHAVGTVCRSSC
jgi:hypothetical protein